MNAIIPRFHSACTAALCLAVVLTAASTIHAQSDVVFMTADDAFIESQLFRFDLGTQSFSTSTGPSDAFLGVTHRNGEVLVADFNEEEIERFAPDGSHIGTFGSPPGAPSFLEVDSSGNVYTTLFAFFLGDPEVAVRLNSAGVVTGTFAADRGIDADAAGNVYAVHNNSLIKYAPNGAVLGSTGATLQPWDLAVDEAGNRLYLANQTNNIRIYDITGNTPAFIGNLTGPASTQFVGVHFAAESGNILAVDNGISNSDPRGLEFSSSGMLLEEYRPIDAAQAWDITTFTPIPEPRSLMLLGLSMLAVTGNLRSRRK
jgi:DNA-binding beta-propeller fold protein YncE